MKKVFCWSILFLVFNVYSQDRKNETKVSKYQIGYFYSMDYSYMKLQHDFNKGFSTGIEISKEIKKENRITLGLYYSKSTFYEEINKLLTSGGNAGSSFTNLYTKVTRQTAFIELPVIWNHILINKPKFNFYFSIGVYPSFYIKANNQAYFSYDSKEKDVDFYCVNTGDSSFYESKINTYHKTNVLLTTLFGFGFDYRINDNFSICIRPEIRSKISFKYEETIKNISVNFGVKYSI